MSEEPLEQEIEKTINIAKAAGEKIEAFILSGEPIILHGGMGLPGASALKTYLQGLNWGKVPIMIPATDFIYGTLPYSEERIRAIFYMGSARERNLAVRMISSLEIMNAEFLIVTPFPEDPILRERASSNYFVSVSGASDPLMAEILASAYASLSYAQKKGKRDDMRISRLEGELNSLKEVYGKLLQEKCGEVSDFVSRSDEIDVVYTPFLQSSASLMYYKLLMMGKKVRLIDGDSSLPFSERLSNVLLFYTSVEEASLKELIFRLQMAKKIAKLFRFNTDPLSALIYASFFSRCLNQ